MTTLNEISKGHPNYDLSDAQGWTDLRLKNQGILEEYLEKNYPGLRIRTKVLDLWRNRRTGQFKLTRRAVDMVSHEPLEFEIHVPGDLNIF